MTGQGVRSAEPGQGTGRVVRVGDLDEGGAGGGEDVDGRRGGAAAEVDLGKENVGEGDSAAVLPALAQDAGLLQIADGFLKPAGLVGGRAELVERLCLTPGVLAAAGCGEDVGEAPDRFVETVDSAQPHAE